VTPAANGEVLGDLEDEDVGSAAPVVMPVMRTGEKKVELIRGMLSFRRIDDNLNL
jgi:hypothetical protein